MVVNSNVSAQRTSQNDLFALKRDRHGDQFAAQKNERRSKVARLSLESLHKARARMVGQGGRNHHSIEYPIISLLFQRFFTALFS